VEIADKLRHLCYGGGDVLITFSQKAHIHN